MFRFSRKKVRFSRTVPASISPSRIGLNIVWVDETAPKYYGVTQATRVNLNRKNAIKDPMPWRFIKNNIQNQ